MHPRGFPAKSEVRIFSLEALVVIYSFTAGAFKSEWPSISADPMALVRLIIPVAVVMAAFWFRKSNHSQGRLPHAAALDVIVAYGLVLLAEWILSAVQPELALPRWAPTQGGFVGFSLIVACRALFPQCSESSADGIPITETELLWKVQDLRATSVQVRRWYLGAGVLPGSAALYFTLIGSGHQRAVSGLIVAGALYVASQVRVRTHGPPAATCNNAGQLFREYLWELRCRYLLLRRLGAWYYGFLLPAAIFALLGSRVYGYWLPLVVLIFAELNYRQAANFRREYSMSVP